MGIFRLLLFFFTTTLVVSGLPPACLPVERSLPPATAPDGSPPDRRQLFRALQQSESILLVYGTRRPEEAGNGRKQAEAFAARYADLPLRILADTAATAGELAGYPLLIVGSPASNRLVDDLGGKLPFAWRGDELLVDGYVFQDPAKVLSLTMYPSPFNPALPLFLFSGSDEAAIWAFFQKQTAAAYRPYAWGNALQVFENDKRVLLVPFAEGGNRVLDYSSAQYYPVGASHSSMPPFELFAYGGLQVDARLNAYLAGLADLLYRIETFVGKTLEDSLLRIEVYPSIETKGMMTRQTRPEEVDHEALTLHKVWNETYREQEGTGAGQLILRQLLGKPARLALEKGLALQFTEKWLFRGYRYWAMRLHRSGNLPTLKTVLDNEDWLRGSPFVLGAAAGSFVEFLLHRLGPEEFIAGYARWQPSRQQLDQLEKDWKSWLDDQPDPVEEPVADTALPYLKGFNFAHQGYDIFNGYGSGQAVASLEKLQKMGANAVSIIPYATLRDPSRPAPLSVDHSARSENDEAVVHAGRAAARLGFRTMMKPHIWVRGGWPGDIRMAKEADWAAFFRYYHDWILHYALLAEAYQFDFLCIGTELSQSTLAREDEWRALIQKVRGLYRGKITYAANWGEEFERLPFWDALDYVGLNCYYPLSADPEASVEDLRRGFRRNIQRVLQVADRAGKPLLFTEIGFTSASTPWINPHEDGRDRQNHPEHQAVCYQVAFEEISRIADCAGLFWWKFPSFPSYSGRPDDICFTPNNKPAADIVKHWFERLGNTDD